MGGKGHLIDVAISVKTKNTKNLVSKVQISEYGFVPKIYLKTL